MENIEAQNEPNKKKPRSRLILILLAAVMSSLIITGMVIHTAVSKKPLYIYRNFTWSPSSSNLAFVRIPLRGKPFVKQPAIQDQEICIVSPGVPDSKKIATFRGKPDSLRIIGWNRDGTSIYLQRDEDSGKELLGIRPEDGRVTRYNLEIPAMTGLWYDRGIFVVLHKDPQSGKKIVGYFDEKSFTYGEIMPLEEKNREKMDLLEVKTAPTGDRIALGIFYMPDEAEEGFTSLCLFDIARGKAQKCQADSRGRNINLAWSPVEPLIAARIEEKNEWGAATFTLCFCDALEPESVQKLSNVEMKKSFELFWSTQNKLFIVMDNAFYLMPINLDKPVAKMLFSWTALGYKPSESSLSPDGQRIVFHILDEREMRDDCFIINVDGTGLRRLIEPEGRRILERTRLYRFLDACRRVIGDFSRILKNQGRK
jgi:hypothetical protein